MSSPIEQRPFLELPAVRQILARSVARSLEGLGSVPWLLEDKQGMPRLVTWEDATQQNSNVWARLGFVSCVDESEPSEWQDPEPPYLVTVRTTKRLAFDCMIESTEPNLSRDLASQLALRIFARGERDRLEALGVVLIQKPSEGRNVSYFDPSSRKQVSATQLECFVRFNQQWIDPNTARKKAERIEVTPTINDLAQPVRQYPPL